MSGERDARSRARNRRSESGDGLLGVSRRPTTSLLRDSPSLLARLLRLSFSFALFTPPYVILGFSRFSRPCSGVYGVCRDQGSGGAHGWRFVGLLAIKGASVQLFSPSLMERDFLFRSRDLHDLDLVLTAKHAHSGGETAQRDISVQGHLGTMWLGLGWRA